MSKQILVCEDYVSKVCKMVTESLNECAKKTMSSELCELVEITTSNYEEILLKTLFDVKGE